MSRERGEIKVRLKELKPNEARVVDSNLLLAIHKEKNRRREPGTLAKIVSVIKGRK